MRGPLDFFDFYSSFFFSYDSVSYNDYRITSLISQIPDSVEVSAIPLGVLEYLSDVIHLDEQFYREGEMWGNRPPFKNKCIPFFTPSVYLYDKDII